MIKCAVEKCPKGIISCCQFCQGKEFCEFVCECKTHCEYQETHDPAMDNLKLQRKHDRQMKKSALIIKIILILAMLILGVIVGQLSEIKTMQTDTLNTLMDTERQIDDLSKENAQVEQVYQNEEKNATRGTERLVQLSQSEREYIERVCMAESNTLDGMFAVANVIYNRSVLWHKSPMQVVQQDSQFASPAQGEISAEAVQAVWAVFDENMKAFEDSNPTHFYADGTAEPYWTENKTYTGTRGGNRFYESRY